MGRMASVEIEDRGRHKGHVILFLPSCVYCVLPSNLGAPTPRPLHCFTAHRTLGAAEPPFYSSTIYMVAVLVSQSRSSTHPLHTSIVARTHCWRLASHLHANQYIYNYQNNYNYITQLKEEVASASQQLQPRKRTYVRFHCGGKHTVPVSVKLFDSYNASGGHLSCICYIRNRNVRLQWGRLQYVD